MFQDRLAAVRYHPQLDHFGLERHADGGERQIRPQAPARPFLIADDQGVHARLLGKPTGDS
jgi:hypothetical protein